MIRQGGEADGSQSRFEPIVANHISLGYYLPSKFNFDDHNCDLLDHHSSFANIDVQGYEADNPNIELLRLKNFTIGRKLQDHEVVGPGALDRIASLVGTMTPFVRSPPFCSAFPFVE